MKAPKAATQTRGDSIGMLAAGAVGIVCCLALPLLAGLGSGALLWLLGVGAPLVLAALGFGLLVAVRRSRNHAAVREPTPPSSTTIDCEPLN